MIEETRYKETTSSMGTNRMGVDPVTAPVRVSSYESTDITRMVGWSPIWAGAVVAVAAQVILLVLGAAIGLSVIRADAVQPTAEGFGAAAGIWWVVSTLIALFAGGWLAGWLGGPRHPASGAVHGLLLWCLVTTLSMAILAFTSGAVLGGGLGILAGDARVGQTQPGITGDIRGTTAGTGDFRFQTGQDAGFGMDTRFDTQNTPMARTAVGVAWWTLAVLLLSAGAAIAGGAAGQRTTSRVGVYNYRSDVGR